MINITGIFKKEKKPNIQQDKYRAEKHLQKGYLGRRKDLSRRTNKGFGFYFSFSYGNFRFSLASRHVFY